MTTSWVLILGLAFETLKTLIPGHPGFVPKLTLFETVASRARCSAAQLVAGACKTYPFGRQEKNAPKHFVLKCLKSFEQSMSTVSKPNLCRTYWGIARSGNGKAIYREGENGKTHHGKVRWIVHNGVPIDSKKAA
jgi:hypothetical protein